MKHFMVPAGVVIAFILVIAFLVGQESSAKTTTPPTPFRNDFVEVKIDRLVVDPASMQPVVLLLDPTGELVMPIWIGPGEAAAIQGELEGIKPPRPMTHDLLESVIQRLNGTVRRVIITLQKESIYYAIIVLEKDRTLIEVDARPSDSIVLALKFKVPIFVSRSLYTQRAVGLPEQKHSEGSYGLTVQELTPQLAESFSFKKGKGVLVADVKEGGRADKDGIQAGDILVHIGEQPIEDLAAMRSALVKIKSPVKVEIFRQGNFSTRTLNPADQ